PARRYMASVWAGIFYLLVGLFGATVAGLFAAFPHALVLAIAGIALVATLGNSLATALQEPDEREAALVTFLVTASGLSLLGIGGGSWGVVGGVVVRRVLREPKKACARHAVDAAAGPHRQAQPPGLSWHVHPGGHGLAVHPPGRTHPAGPSDGGLRSHRKPTLRTIAAPALLALALAAALPSPPSAQPRARAR